MEWMYTPENHSTERYSAPLHLISSTCQTFGKSFLNKALFMKPIIMFLKLLVWTGCIELRPFKVMKKTLLCILLLMACFSRCTADLLAYDCAHQFANRTKINMLTTAPCNVKSSNETVEQSRIYLIQPREFYKVHVKSCKISVIRDINDCSTFSDNRVLGGFLSYIHETTFEECENMHRFLNTKFYNNIISGLKPNGSTSASLNLAGKIYHHNGGCKGGVWSENGITWEDVYVTASVSITLKDYWAEAAVDGETVRLQSGYDCKLNEQHCVDPEDGYTLWEDNYKDESCERDSYELIYSGIANKTTMNLDNEESILYSVSDDVAFSLLIKTSTFVCGHRAYQTEHPKLKIVEHNGYDMSFKKTDDAYNLNMFTYINSKFTFLERHTKNQLVSLHKALLTNQCELDKSILNTQLAMAFLSPTDFAYLRMGKPGYTALPAGEVMYLVKCQAVSVKRRFVEKCYQEFPVEYKNSTWFMAPRTHILMMRGNEIPCSEIVPVNYNIDNKWYSFSPKIHETVEPTSIVPKSESGWKYSDPIPLINTGLYSQDDLENMRKQLMFPLDKGVILSAMSNKVTFSPQSKSEDEFDFSNLISEKDVKSSVEQFFLKTTGILSIFGSCTSIVIGFWMVYTVSKWIADFLFHLFSLYKEFGLNYKLSAAMWSTLSHHMVVNSRMKQCSKNQTDADTELLQMGNSNKTEFEKRQESIDQTSNHPSTTSLPRHHYRIHYYNANFHERLENFMCLPDKSCVKVVQGGLLIETPTLKIERPGFHLLGIYNCTCVRSMFVEGTTNHFPSFGEGSFDTPQRVDNIGKPK